MPTGGIDPSSLDGYVGTGLDAEEQQLVAGGQKVQAIKHYRERTGAGLKEAKDAVEAASRG